MQTRIVGLAVSASMVYFIFQKLSLDKSLIANLNGFKREFATLAAGLVLFHAGGGRHFVPNLIGYFKAGKSEVLGASSVK